MAWPDVKHVPASMRRRVLERDGHRCTAVQLDGTRCPETTQLEAHHIEGFRLGEVPRLDMFATLCSWHHERITVRQAAAALKARPNWRENAIHPSKRAARGD